MNALFRLFASLRQLAILISLAILTGCATSYQPMSALGGYREIQLAPDIYRVMFFGNGYTNSELAVEYALRRCAELTQQNGYRYFGILSVEDFTTQSSYTIPGSAYTTGNLNVNQFGNTAFGTYTGRTFITPAQTVQFNFPRPVITIKMLNAQIPGTTLFDAGTVLSNQLPGAQNTSVARNSPVPLKYTGPRIEPDPRLKARVISFVKGLIPILETGSPESIASLYAPTAVVNGKQLSHEAMLRQLRFASSVFPQRTIQLLSGPTVVGPSQDRTGCTVQLREALLFKNGHAQFDAIQDVQAEVELDGDQLKISSITTSILEQHFHL
jgi:hypothetical protein